ncbi:MAG: hypothetical protein LBK42_14715 [Propionibacteriaceae bacterium]|nr:hypothetical protein [Propionibacteriaceae bacterium]
MSKSKDPKPYKRLASDSLPAFLGAFAAATNFTMRLAARLGSEEIAGYAGDIASVVGLLATALAIRALLLPLPQPRRSAGVTR